MCASLSIQTRRLARLGGRGLIALSLIGFTSACASEASRSLTQPITVPFESPLNLIVVDAHIGDSGPFRFFLDSGATSTVIDIELAQRLGLDTGDARTRRGTAAKSQVTVAPVNGGARFTLAPGFAIHVDRVITAPFTNTGWVMVGEHFDGILGSAFFHRFVIEADYAERTLTFHEPADYRYQGSGKALELGFPSQMPKLPFIKATLINDGKRLDDFPILVDSGGQTMGTASVAKRSEWDGLITSKNRIVDAMGATGLSNDAEGTTHASFATKMDRLHLGPFTFEEPRVSFSAGGPGVAVMGASLLHRFTAVFDYSRKRLILEPNEHYNTPIVADRSGTFFAMTSDGDGTFEVMFVAQGSPGDKAGLVRGDIIQAVDGVPTPDLQLNELRMRFTRDGKFRLDVLREGQSVETFLKTRSLYD